MTGADRPFGDVSVATLGTSEFKIETDSRDEQRARAAYYRLQNRFTSEEIERAMIEIRNAVSLPGKLFHRHEFSPSNSSN